jgi:hypothetical protein
LAEIDGREDLGHSAVDPAAAKAKEIKALLGGSVGRVPGKKTGGVVSGSGIPGLCSRRIAGSRRLGLGVLLAFTVKGIFATAAIVVAMLAATRDDTTQQNAVPLEQAAGGSPQELAQNQAGAVPVIRVSGGHGGAATQGVGEF